MRRKESAKVEEDEQKYLHLLRKAKRAIERASEHAEGCGMQTVLLDKAYKAIWDEIELFEGK